MSKNIAIRFTVTRMRCNVVAPGVADTPTMQAWAAGELLGSDKMLKYSDLYTNTELAPTQPIDQANAILFLASDISKAITGRVLTVDNDAFM